MLSGFDKAVGPVHPREQPELVAYPCQIAIDTAAPAEECMYQLFDGGAGKTFVRCATHDYSFVAIDWTAPHFGGGLTLPEAIDSIRASLESIRSSGVEGLEPEKVTVHVSRFGDLFEAITRNLDVIAKSVKV